MRPERILPALALCCNQETRPARLLLRTGMALFWYGIVPTHSAHDEPSRVADDKSLLALTRNSSAALVKGVPETSSTWEHGMGTVDLAYESCYTYWSAVVFRRRRPGQIGSRPSFALDPGLDLLVERSLLARHPSLQAISIQNTACAQYVCGSVAVRSGSCQYCPQF